MIQPRQADMRTRLRRPLRKVYRSTVLRMDRRYRRLSERQQLPEGIRRVYCYHVRKTAGTSLNRSFLALGGEEPLEVERRMATSTFGRTSSGEYTFAAHYKRALERGNYFYGWTHRPAHMIALPPETFTVTILRDPLKRAVSYYTYLVGGDEPNSAFGVAPAEQSLAANGFSAFLDVVPKEHLLRQLYMFSPHFDPADAAERIARCSFTFWTDRYEEGLGALAAPARTPTRGSARTNVARRLHALGRRARPADRDARSRVRVSLAAAVARSAGRRYSRLIQVVVVVFFFFLFLFLEADPLTAVPALIEPTLPEPAP